MTVWRGMLAQIREVGFGFSIFTSRWLANIRSRDFTFVVENEPTQQQSETNVRSRRSSKSESACQVRGQAARCSKVSAPKIQSCSKDACDKFVLDVVDRFKFWVFNASRSPLAGCFTQKARAQPDEDCVGLGSSHHTLLDYYCLELLQVSTVHKCGTASDFKLKLDML